MNLDSLISFLSPRLAQSRGRMRLDAGETAAVARQLNYTMAKTVDVIQPPIKARLLLPVNHEIPAGASTFTWRQWDIVGMAQLISAYATDIPKVAAFFKEVTGHVRELADAYDFTLSELEAAAFSNTPLDAKKGAAAKLFIERKIDSLAARGDTAALLPGFINNANVPLIVSPAIHGDWTNPATTSRQILDDLGVISWAVFTNTKETHQADTVVMPPALYKEINVRLFSDTVPETILSVFLRTTPHIKNVESWEALTNANAAGNGPRVISYPRDPMVVELMIPMEFSQLPPQVSGLMTEIICRAKVAGVQIYLPIGVTYADL